MNDIRQKASAIASGTLRFVRAKWPWGLVAILATLAVLAYVLGLSADATYLFAALAAIVSVIAIIFERRDAGEQSAQLNELVTIAKETRAHQLANTPRPRVQLLLPPEWQPVEALRLIRKPLPVIAVDQIIESEVGPLRRSLPATPAQPADLGLRPQNLLKYLHDMHAQQVASVDSFERSLRDWMDEAGAYLRELYARANLRFACINDGGGPLTDARIMLTFPTGISEAADLPVVLDAPSRPEPGNFSVGAALNRRYASLLDAVPEAIGPKDGPWWEEGGHVATVGFDKVLHGLREDWSLMVSVPADGEYRVEWAAHGSNLDQRSGGELRFEVLTAGDPDALNELKSVRAALRLKDE